MRYIQRARLLNNLTMPKNQYLKTQSAFTLIELLIVISVVGILSGVLVNVIDSKGQKNKALDSVHRKDINDLAVSIESYRTAEGSYPDEGTENNPLDPSASTRNTAAVYITEWPVGVIYIKNDPDFAIYIQKEADTNFIKYNSVWREFRECADTTNPTSITDCD